MFGRSQMRPPALSTLHRSQDSTCDLTPLLQARYMPIGPGNDPCLLLTPDGQPIRHFPMKFAALAGTNYGYAGWGQTVYRYDIILSLVCYKSLYSIYV